MILHPVIEENKYDQETIPYFVGGTVVGADMS
jgi:hypothetical protein